MRVIHKYPISSQCEIEVGQNAVALTAEAQYGQMMLWVEHGTGPKTERVKVEILGTGFDVPEGMRYLNTIFTKAGFVWHVYVGNEHHPGH